MKLSDLIKSVGELGLVDDPNIIIELEDNCLKYTVKVSAYVDFDGSRHLRLLTVDEPVSSSKQHSVEEYLFY